MIKHLLLSIITFLFLLGSASAQNFNFSNFKVGLKGGIGFSKFTEDVGPFDPEYTYYNSESGYEKYIRIGALAGIKIDYDFTGAFSLGAELLHNGRGDAYRAENSSVTVISSNGAEKAYNYYQYRINYLEFPLLAQYNLVSGESSSLALVIYGGLAPGFVTTNKITQISYESSGPSPYAKRKVNSEELNNVRNLNISPVAGIKLGGNGSENTGRIFLDLRVSKTALPVFTVDTDNGMNFKTSMWTTSVAVGVYLNQY